MPFGDTVGKSVNLCTEFLTTVRCELPCVSVPSIEKLLPSFFLICNTAPFCAIVNPDNPDNPFFSAVATVVVLNVLSLDVSFVAVVPSTVKVYVVLSET